METSKPEIIGLDIYQIERIKNEEILRMKIREEFNPPKNDKGRFWNFVNSHFGLWLFSSVAIGLITWGYTKWSEDAKIKKDKERVIAEIDIEMAYRLANIEIKLQDAKSLSSVESAVLELTGAGNEVGRDISGSITVLNSYKDLAILELVFRLKQSVPTKDKTEMDDVLRGLMEIKRRYGIPATVSGNMTKGQFYNDSLTMDNLAKKSQILHLFESQIFNKRWRLN